MTDVPWTSGPWTHMWSNQHCQNDCIIDSDGYHVCQPPMYENCRIIELTPDMASALLGWYQTKDTTQLDEVAAKVHRIVELSRSSSRV